MSARGRKSANPLDKKIPENPKFKHVRSTIDTGASLSKYMEKLEEMKRDYNFKKDEIFKRMKIPTFAQLVVQVADFDTCDTIAEEGEPYNDSGKDDRPDTADQEVQRIQKGQSGAGDGQQAQTPVSEIDTSRSRLEQVINGLGEVDLDEPAKLRTAPLPMMGDQCPYLLLDVRDRDAYDECHIITAKSYPTAMLARSVNYETKDMLNFKNKPGKIILLYDDDETISHRAATTLVQRGYDNLFMLSGGLRMAYKQFPDGLITGTMPAGLIEDLPGIKGLPKKSKAQPVERVPADVTSFTQEHVDKLCEQLDGVLSDRSVGSRLSKTSRQGRATSMSSNVSTVSSFGRKPFKP
ncbi:centrosomal protein of 41 kda [Plakobranchus ocellatus]|uniref:Centrosomal protein of 41 kDa n=1 Tax=Plakobranchus ocellatus TaxID=259542 RepID=A0AAV3ZS94_9GAST|nr:centrosomal protein of 41 kda [Plakobranchus ocellatus]